MISPRFARRHRLALVADARAAMPPVRGVVAFTHEYVHIPHLFDRPEVQAALRHAVVHGPLLVSATELRQVAYHRGESEGVTLAWLDRMAKDAGRSGAEVYPLLRSR